MKKLIILFLMTALIFTSCMGRDKNDPVDTSEVTDTGDIHDNTLGDDNGDGIIEDETDDGIGGNIVGDVLDGAETLASDIINGADDILNGNNGTDMNGDNMLNNDTNGGTRDTNFIEVNSVKSADDALNFIGANVYSRCKDVIPMMTETKILSTDDIDSISYNTGLTNTNGIEDIIVSDSSLDSFAYSLVMLRTDGTNTDTLQNELSNTINPGKWLGVVAEKVASLKLDNDIIVVMGGTEQVDTIMNSVMEAANGVYENVGDIISVMG